MKHMLFGAAALSALGLFAPKAGASVAPDPGDSSVLVGYVEEGETETYAEKIDRKYSKFVKTGKGTLVLTAESSKSSATDFMGTVEIREGILESQNFYALKECSYDGNNNEQGRILVSSNAQLRVTFASKGQNSNAFYNLAIEGDGPDGKGAFVFNGSECGDNLVRHLILTGDASIGGTGRFGVGYWGYLHLNGHVLKGTTSEYYFRDIRSKASESGHFVKEGGSVTFQRGEHQSYLRGGAENTFTVDHAALNFWSGTDLDVDWTLKLIGSQSILAHSDCQWNGPIVGDGGPLDIYSDNDSGKVQFSIGGSITNVATLRPHNSGGHPYHLKLVNSDHYLGDIVMNKGQVTITGGVQQVMGFVSLVDFSKGMRFIDAGTVQLTNDESRVYSKQDQEPARLEFIGKTVVNGAPGTRLQVGDHGTASWTSGYPYYWGSLTVADGAVLTNDLNVGYRGMCAVYQRNSEIYERNGLDLGWGNNNNDGVKAYGYWGLSNSLLTVNGPLRMGAIGSTGIMVQKGGLTELASGNKLYLSEYGHATLHVSEGGSFRMPNGSGVFFGGSGDGGSATVTVEGENSLIDFSASPISWMCHKNFQTHLNLNDGGVFSCYRFQYESLRTNLETSRSYLSFNGGCLRLVATKIGQEYRAFMPWDTSTGVTVESHPDHLIVYEKGAIFDAATTNSTIHFDSAIEGPTGKSVTAIALPTDETFLAATQIGALRVIIEDTAGGEGASAYLAFDEITGKPSKIVVTSPGINYHEGTTTAKVMPMRGDASWDCASVTLADAVGGGLVKKGPGTLILRRAATYPGATMVCEGTLTLGATNIFPANQPLVLAGGMMNFGNNSGTVSSLSGYGTVESSNGKSLTITEGLTLASADLAAGRTLKFVTMTPTFADGTTIALDPTGLPEGDEPFRRTVMTSTSEIVGEPTFTGVPKGWYLHFTPDRKGIVCGRERGLAIILR